MTDDQRTAAIIGVLVLRTGRTETTISESTLMRMHSAGVGVEMHWQEEPMDSPGVRIRIVPHGEIEGNV